MEHWAPLRDAARRASILHAIREHDNGWRELDARPSADPASGRVVDFIEAPAAVRQAVWPRGVSRLSRDPWAAALVAQHALVIYERSRGDAQWTEFFEEMAAHRDRLLDACGGLLEALLEDYVFVRAGDLISLIVCNGWREPHTVGGWTVALEADRVMVSPDPFGGREVPFAVEARAVPDAFYASDAELRRAVDSAPVIRLEGTATGRSR